MEEVMSKEHELLSLGGQAAAAAHSLGTPFSTMKIISADLLEQFKDNEDVKKDIELLSSQLERCSEILKKLTLNPVIEDNFIDGDLTISDYVDEIIKSFQETSKKNFIVNYDQNSNPLNITKSIEIVYGLRNFIGNANKFSANKIFIDIKSDSNLTEVIIEDDFIDRDLSISNYVDEIVKSFQEISKKEFNVNCDQNSNPLNITKSIEIVYGLRNFIGNANKFAENRVFINIKSDNDLTEVIIEDDGEGYPKDVLSKIGEPYIKSVKSSKKSKSGLGLGIFIGKTLLEKNYANILCRNSETRGGAEVRIKWKNKDLLNL